MEDSVPTEFRVKWCKRSSGKSTPANQLPGDSAIAKINPDRSEKLMDLTGWSRVQPGTLNLYSHDTSIADGGSFRFSRLNEWVLGCW